MLSGLVRMALRQRLVIVIVGAVLLGFGVDATRKLSVDAFPDVTNVQVQVATVSPGRSPEEVERFITIPVEIAMTGLPGLEEMRSLNKPGLSLLTLVFTDSTPVYFARQVVMERLAEVRENLPAGAVPVLGPVATAMSEVFHYTLDRPTDGTRALAKEELVNRRTVQDWVVRPLLRSLPGVAEINSTGGYIRQYQVLVDPIKLRYYGIGLNDVTGALARNNANSGGGILPQGSEQFLVRGVGLIRTLDDIRSIILKETAGTPVFIRDVGEVRLGEEVRYGAMIKGGYTEGGGRHGVHDCGRQRQEGGHRGQAARRRDQLEGHAAGRPSNRPVLRPVGTGGRGAVDRGQGADRRHRPGDRHSVPFPGRSAVEPDRHRDPPAHSRGDPSS